MLATRDREHAEGLVAVGAGDDGHDARDFQRLRYIDIDDLAVRIRTAIDTAGQLTGAKNVRGVFGAAGDLLRSVDHRHIRADVVCGCGFVHGAMPCLPSATANFTASM